MCLCVCLSVYFTNTGAGTEVLAVAQEPPFDFDLIYFLVKALFINPTDAHNYKITGMLKQLKFPQLL